MLMTISGREGTRLRLLVIYRDSRPRSGGDVWHAELVSRYDHHERHERQACTGARRD